MVNSFFKKRTHLGCLGASIDFFGANIYKITRKTILWTLAFATISGLLSTFNSAQDCNPMYILALLGLGVCGMFLLDAKIKATFLSLLDCGQGHGIFNKTLRTYLWVALLLALCCISFIIVNGLFFAPNATLTHAKQGHSLTLMLGTNALLGVAMLLLILPFCYSCTRYVFTEGARFKDIFGKKYIFGIRKIGFIFTMAFILTLIAIVALILLTLPSIIITTAQHIDMYGVLSGDTSGIPSYFGMLTFVSLTIMSFIMQYISLWLLLTLCFAYGSLESNNIPQNTTDN